MTVARTATEKLVLTLQWALAVVLFELGLLQAGLPLAELQARFGAGVGDSGDLLVAAGLAQALVAMLIVVPTVTGFLPRVAPLAAGVAALALAAAGAGELPGLALGLPALADVLALAAGLVAVMRLVLPLAAIDLGPEPRDPWHRPAAQLKRLRRYQAAHGWAPIEEEARRPDTMPAPAGQRRRSTPSQVPVPWRLPLPSSPLLGPGCAAGMLLRIPTIPLLAALPFSGCLGERASHPVEPLAPFTAISPPRAGPA